MAERSIAVRLRAEAGEFKRALSEGVKSLKDVETAAAQAASKVEKAKADMAAASKRAEAAEKTLGRAQDRAAQAAAGLAKAEANLGQKRSSSRATAESIARAEAQVDAARKRADAAASKLGSTERAMSTQRDRLKAATDATAAAEAKHKAALEQVTRTQKAAETSTGRLTQSLKTNQAEWQQTGGMLAAAGTATLAVAGATIKTGVAYNSLQQTSRAALKTMLGGAEAVNAQMDQLDAFAKTSPFSKQTFIQAQQQMLAFGIESKKVIPYLSAINDATAASGGNSQKLGEIAFVMAQISAAGKITGQDLIQFGQRGINAAELIGSQMGKTGGEIREQITAGAIGADEALDALAAGMSQKFEGASENVKNTWEGSLDRVSAAWRDLAAQIAEPLVSADGGGSLVDLANSLADVVRWVEKLPAPIKQGVASMSTLVGIASALAGAMLLLGPRVIENVSAIRALGREHPKAVGAIKGAGLAAVAYTIVSSLDAWTESMRKARNGGEADLPALQKSLANFAGNGKLAGEALRYFGEDLEGIEDAFKDTSGWQSNIGRVNKSLGTWGWVLGPAKGATEEWARSLSDGEEKLAAFDGTLVGLVNSGDLESAAALEAEFARRATEAGWSVEQVDHALSGYRVALEDAKGATEGATEATTRFQGASEATASAIAAQRETLTAASDAFIDLGAAYDAVIEQNRALAEETAAATKSSEDSWEDFYDGVSVSAEDYIGELQRQVEAQEQWASNLVTLSERIATKLPEDMRGTAEEMLDELAALGPEGAAEVALLESMSAKELKKVVDLYGRKGAEAGDALVSKINARRPDPILLEMKQQGFEGTYDYLMRLQKIVKDINGRPVRISTGYSGGQTLATGGQVSGPGTGTSDSIPAMLSNGEHVWTAAEVAAAGGQGAMYRARGLVRAGALRFAVGGAVGDADKAVARAAKAKKSAQAALREEKGDAASAQRAYDRAEGAAARKSAKKRLDAAKKDLKAAENALRDADKALSDARARRSRLREDRADFGQDVRRGRIGDQITGGLDSSLGVVDRARDLADSGDLSKKQSARLRKASQEAEKALTKQYGLLDKQNEKIDRTKALLSDVKGLHDSVAASIMGEVRLTDLLNQKTEFGHDKPVTAGSIRAYVADKLAKVRGFNSKLNALRKRGAPNALLQEVLASGIDGGTALATALLSASAGDWGAITRDWRALEQASSQTGDIATQSQYGTTVAQTEALLASQEKQADKITKEITKIGKGLQKALGTPLGFAGGGLVSGPGTGTSDSILARLSAGEHVTNAASTAANLPLLQAINASGGRPVTAAPVASAPSMSTAAIAAALMGMTIQIAASVGVDRKTSAAIVGVGVQEVRRTDPGILRGVSA